MVLIRFWRSLTKKDSVERARYEIPAKIFFYLYPLVLGRLFQGSGSGFFRIGAGFSADPDSEKSLIRIREKNPIRNTAKKSYIFPSVS